MAGEHIDAVEMLRRLVAFDTTSRNSNLELIDFVRHYLRGHGVESELVFDHGGAKANLYATLGPRETGGIILSGHTDVVPIDDQDWTTDPWRLTEQHGLLYGRGSCDMKGFVACCLALVPEFLARGLKEPIHLAFSYDEEVGCLGVHSLIEHVVANHPKPRLCLVGEPTMMQVVDAHKGIRSFFTTVTGLEAHSSATHVGVNAIMVAADLIGFLGRMGEELKARGDATGRFTPPYTTLSVGTIEGGTAVNIIPRHCRFAWEYRPLPGTDADEPIRRFEEHVRTQVMPALEEKAPGVAAITTVPRSVTPALSPDPGSAAEVLAKALAGTNETLAVSYATEAGIFQVHGIPTVVCGPGDILQAHRPNEFVALDQIRACTAFLRKLADRVCAA
ncbi:acetylornithine deacetylase [Zavarzinia sp.]|uniref:acetylornithine deacetylase n=1 Tax=Zavarzinia sp. TaxID=2027920 RepID=UPI00356B29CF